MTLTERTVIHAIRVQLPERAIEVTRAHQVLRDGEVIVSTLQEGVQRFVPELPVPEGIELEPELLAVLAAVWTPADVAAAGAALVEVMARVHAEAMDKQRAQLAELEQASKACAARMADHEEVLQALKRSGEAVAAAHRELEAEHQVLAERSAKVTADRAELFTQAESIRKQRPKLAKLLDELTAELKALCRTLELAFEPT